MTSIISAFWIRAGHLPIVLGSAWMPNASNVTFMDTGGRIASLKHAGEVTVNDIGIK